MIVKMKKPPKKIIAKIEKTKNITISRSKYQEDKDKLEKQIEVDHVAYCVDKKIYFKHTKVKGEPQWNKKTQTNVRKKSTNKGFFDMILMFPGSIVVFLELKAGSGGVWLAKQIEQYNEVIKAGGFALCSNSVRDTHNFLVEKGLVK